MTLQLALIVGSVAVLVAFMQLVRVIAARFAWSAELQRKAVHVATGAYAMALPALFSEHWPVLLLVAVTLVVMLILRQPRIASGGLGAAIHSVERKSYGDMLFAVAVGFLFFRSVGVPILYVLPLAVLTLSDTAAALAGSTYGRRHFTVEDGVKSYEGVAMFFLVTWIIAMVALLLLTDVPRITVVLLGVIIAAFGALVEADSWRGLDNLFLPIGLHLFLEAYLHQPPLAIGAVALAFLLLISTLLAFAPMLGLTAHSARAYAVALFLICCYTAPQNAILPVVAVGVHLWTRKRAPNAAAHADLESIASIALVSFAWLAVGEWFGKTAINFYSLTFAGIIAALVVIGLKSTEPSYRRMIGATSLCAIAALYAIVVASGEPAALWHRDLSWPLIATLLLPVAIWTIKPDVFDTQRAARVATIAAVVPAISYAINVAQGGV
jgi:phytol kinase